MASSDNKNCPNSKLSDYRIIFDLKNCHFILFSEETCLKPIITRVCIHHFFQIYNFSITCSLFFVNIFTYWTIYMFIVHFSLDILYWFSVVRLKTVFFLQVTVKMDTTLFPYSIFLFLKGGGGDRVLFRYPYNVMPKKRQVLSEANGKVTASTSNLNRSSDDRPPSAVFRHKRTNPYSLPPVTDGLFLPDNSTSSKQNNDVLQVRFQTLLIVQNLWHTVVF